MIGSSKAKILQQDEFTVYITIVAGRSGNFELKYVRENEKRWVGGKINQCTILASWMQTKPQTIEKR